MLPFGVRPVTRRSSCSHHPEPVHRNTVRVPWTLPTPGGSQGSPGLCTPRGQLGPLDSPHPRGGSQGLWIHPTPGGQSGSPWIHPAPGDGQGPWIHSNPKGQSGSPWIHPAPGDGQDPPAFLSGTEHHGCFLLLSCGFSRNGGAGRGWCGSPHSPGALWLEVEVSWLPRAAYGHVHMQGVTSPGEA